MGGAGGAGENRGKRIAGKGMTLCQLEAGFLDRSRRPDHLERDAMHPFYEG
jgi:hypothetical protein